MEKLKLFGKRLLKTIAVLFVLLNIVCAFHAYKLTHFYNAKEAMPVPEKMSWSDKISAGILGVKFSKSICATKPSAYENVTLKTDDSLQLEGWYIDRDSAKYNAILPKGTVILFHGHGGKKSDLLPEANEFYALGYNVFLIDFRAHGNSDGNLCTIGFEESKDVKVAYDFIEAKGEKNIILYGVSLGAATILKAFEDGYINPQKIILEMPFGTLQDAVKGRLKIMNLPQQPFASLLTFWGGAEQGFWAFKFKPQEYAKKVNCPTLLQWGSNDKRVSAKETNTIFQSLNTTQKTFVEYKNSAHQSLCINENGKWKTEVANFLNKK